MDPLSKVDYSHITPEATMVVEKAFGRVPGRTPGSPDLATVTMVAYSMFRGKEIHPLGFSR
jgi:hypothetical protein